MIMGEDNLKSLQMEKLWGPLQNHESMFTLESRMGKSIQI
jgi:hypothetical protein